MGILYNWERIDLAEHLSIHMLNVPIMVTSSPTRNLTFGLTFRRIQS